MDRRADASCHISFVEVTNKREICITQQEKVCLFLRNIFAKKAQYNK